MEEDKKEEQVDKVEQVEQVEQEEQIEQVDKAEPVEQEEQIEQVEKQEQDIAISKNKIDIKKVIKLLLKIVYNFIIILCFILIALIFLQKLSDSQKSLFGYRIFRVVTGSMEPEYETGIVIISKEKPASDIKVGDDIVYLSKFNQYEGKLIMHKVVAIDKDENNNNINFHAKGLNNTSMEDPNVKPNQIYGVVIFQSKILTLLYNLATNLYTSFIIIIILVINVFISFRDKNQERISNERITRN